MLPQIQGIDKPYFCYFRVVSKINKNTKWNCEGLRPIPLRKDKLIRPLETNPNNIYLILSNSNVKIPPKINYLVKKTI